MIVTIKRQKYPGAEPYYQTFEYNGTRDNTVAGLLDDLNYTDDLYDIEGNPATRIHWSCGCMQKICGACAMVINGTPALACNTFLKDIKGDKLLLEPMTKFPVVMDLIVDRSVLDEAFLKTKMYMGKFAGPDEKEYKQQYSAAKCLKCGLCLEACPNYDKGEKFLGGMFANKAYLLYTQSEDRRGEILSEYKEHFAKGCSKSLACQKVCPMGISTLSSMLKMNRAKNK